MFNNPINFALVSSSDGNLDNSRIFSTVNISLFIIPPIIVSFSFVFEKLANFSKTNEKLTIIGGIMNKEILTVEKILELSKLPSLDETRAKLIGLLNTPAQRITGLVAAPAGKVANVINAFSKSN